MSQTLINIENVLFYGTVAAYVMATLGYFVSFALKKENMAKIAVILITVGFCLHTLSIIVRGIGAGRVPLSNQFEFATAFAWGIALCYLLAYRKYKVSAMGTFIAPILFLVIGYAAMQSKEVRELMPALQSNWLVLHVSTAIISYGSFAVSCGISLLYLFYDKISEDRRKGMPEKKKLDMMSYRVITFGFMFLTIVMITGAIWAQRAWGHYWTWDPKETWSLITWIIYALYLHVRINRRWSGKRTAMFAVIGFICVIFTFIGVNTFIPSIHSYA
ncbi:MAG: c-type cytochrome biogenesis protein CcsB [Eubacteriales bacterium]|nr:c-type cytochrome biogenesis protein CcsB [Eubacteriales bacterium]